MTTSTSYRQHLDADIDELYIGEPIAHLPPRSGCFVIGEEGSWAELN
jgi:hypothetical protein